MADFGIKSTSLSGPAGAGSKPLIGVRGAVEDDSLPSGLLNVAQSLAVDYVDSAKQAKVSPILSEMSGSLSTLSTAVETGSMSSSSAATRARSIVNKALQNSGGDPALVKSITEVGKTYFGMSNIEPAMSAQEEAVKRENAFNTTVINRLSENGFPVSPNPTPEQLQSYKDLDSSIQSSKAKMQRDKQNLDLTSGTYKFNQEQAQDVIKNKTNEFVSKNLEPSMNTLSSTAVALKKQIADGKITPEAAMQQLTATSEFFRKQLLQISPGNPQYVNDVMGYTDSYMKTLKDSLDPKVTLDSLQTQIAIQNSKDRILLMTNLDVRAAAAALAITPNNPLLQEALNPQILAAVTPLALSFDPNKNTGQNINMGDPTIRKSVYQTARTSIGAVLKEMNRPQGDTVNGPQKMSNMVNNLLAQGANMSNDPNIKDTDAQDFVNFLASDEFKQWRQKGELNEQAMQGAQNMFSRVYLKQIQKRIIDKFEQPVNKMPPNSSILVDMIEGSHKSPTLKYADVVDVQFNNGSVQFVPRNIKGMDMLQQKEVANMMSDLKQTTSVINTAIRAGANVSKAESLQDYWDKNKQNILPYFFGASGNNVKVGDVVNGMKYVGGSVKSRYSWEPVNGKAN